ncbi:phosphomethylpyrimidine synthase ThiC [Methanococcoides alaskense]|uniref:Phosphomethylpyrimidine synthase n=1 Tax=Methanococcoides alaskense TaxID=325778 RepID=A0AA90U0T4_9EURY|nr:phosphomethylpyrimidine synthase ThiC [Methanococcoides alaskense]MDA0524382.1 phosphomethylpyrimidine synthase ThiC [Methanococcoides alaskense]MDR6223198.1 phosphomethylpyrimidine synthase [Methanococcoides alaskense]
MTLMEDARKGLITPEIRSVAEVEGIDADLVRSCVAKGLVTIPKNIKGKSRAFGIGKYMSVKVNANIGTSRDFVNIDEEVDKAKTAVEYGADTIMDLSTGGDLDLIRSRIMDAVDVPIGTVPIYQAAASHKTVVDMTSDDMFNAVRKHAEDGVDFVTIHSGVNYNALERLKKGDRITNVVSRGGSFTIAWMIHNEQENPFYSEYDYLVEIAKEYDLTISLGDGMRPGCIHDASDAPKFMEFITLGELVSKARESDVQTFVEGPGHVPLNEVELSVKAMKELCHGAPLYLLGPLVTDIAPGYDHITGAIGGTLAGMYGADFLCMTTPAEHLALPTIDDIREGAIVTNIAAHAADLTREGQKEKARELDDRMAHARAELDWETQYEVAIDSEKARKIRESRNTGTDACSMCGELCAMKIVKSALEESRQKDN